MSITVDGQAVDALQGDTVMIALLNSGTSLRQSEFTDSNRSGFCLMGACQDCWVWMEDGSRLRSCSTLVEEGMSIVTTQPGELWAIR